MNVLDLLLCLAIVIYIIASFTKKDIFIYIDCFLVLCLIVLFVWMGFVDKELYVKNEYQITCISDNSSVQGQVRNSIFLSSGYIGEKLKYRAFTINENGGKNIVEYDADKCTLFEDGQTKVVEYGYRYNDKYKMWFGDGDNNKTVWYEIHIPQNSITTEYNIDLK